MNELQTGVGRIVVLAQPAVGRMVEAILHNAGHEVHRTPDDGMLSHLVARLRPHLVIVALDIPWVSTADVVHQLTTLPRSIPVLLLGEAEDDPRLDAHPRLPLAVDAGLLLAAVSSLLTTADLGPG